MSVSYAVEPYEGGGSPPSLGAGGRSTKLIGVWNPGSVIGDILDMPPVSYWPSGLEG